MDTLGNMFSLGFCLNEMSFLKDKHYKNKSMQQKNLKYVWSTEMVNKYYDVMYYH